MVWFRRDLRLADNPALFQALNRAAEGPVLPVFIWSPEEEGAWPPGTAARWWLAQSLRSLDRALRDRGSRLILRRGPAAGALLSLAHETGARSLFWNRRFEPAARKQEEEVRRAAGAEGLAFADFNGALLFEPGEVVTRGGSPFQVFTPFWAACLGRGDPPLPASAPRALPAPKRWPSSVPVTELFSEAETVARGRWETCWNPGEAGGRDRLRRFVARDLQDYPEQRDHPALPGTSRLSPHLSHGEISPGQIWHAVARARSSSRPGRERASAAFLRQVGWREFAYHLLFHFPATPQAPLRQEYASFPWRRAPAELRSWKEGRTGYPLVDAGMRELSETGWMHNRVRMVTASFLVKHLLVNWLEGARWFWDNLVDADLANNTLGWQWAAGCGADAAPFFRIFNPTLQSRRFDPAGEYLRMWGPGPGPEEPYPRPMVDHAAARSRALAAWSDLRQGRRERRP